ncbi:hypothetical protein [Nostoc sp.]
MINPTLHLVYQRSPLAESNKAIAINNTHIIAIVPTKILDPGCANTFVVLIDHFDFRQFYNKSKDVEVELT